MRDGALARVLRLLEGRRKDLERPGRRRGALDDHAAGGLDLAFMSAEQTVRRAGGDAVALRWLRCRFTCRLR